MSTTVENPATIYELTRYIEREHPQLKTSYNDRHEQVMIVGQPGKPEPPAALREIIGGERFEARTETVATRGRWIGVITGSENGGKRG